MDSLGRPGDPLIRSLCAAGWRRAHRSDTLLSVLLVRRMFLILGALALLQPSLSAVLLACPMPQGDHAAMAGMARMSGAKLAMPHERHVAPDDSAAACSHCQQDAGPPATTEHHPCPDSAACLAGTACSGASSVATVSHRLVVDVTPRHSRAQSSGDAPPSWRVAPESPPPRR